MKHSSLSTVLLLCIFVASQFIGLLVLSEYRVIETNPQTQEITSSFRELPIGERPELSEQQSYIFIILAILVGTALMLGLIKLNATAVFKGWFFLAVVLTLIVSLAAFMNPLAAATIAIIAALYKTFKPNVIIHNLTELLIYPGLAAIFVPILSLQSVSILLILISIYDAYAVWKSKHMVTLATAQTKTGIFAGAMIPSTLTTKTLFANFSTQTKKSSSSKKTKRKSAEKSTQKKSVSRAILGGGDIAFPLLFSGVLFIHHGFLAAVVGIIGSTVSLAGLFYISEKGKFYPAMPFISAGCFLALAINYVVGLV